MITIVMMPWSVKILFGIISDTVPLFGSRKKSWLIAMGLLQFVALMICAFAQIKSPYILCVFLCLKEASGAFMDVIVDAMMVIQAKRDPLNGSQELQSLSQGFSGMAAIFGGLTAAFTLESLDPYVCFAIYSVFGLVVAFCALLIDSETEEDQT